MKIARYAPSPTGPLHLGNLRTALLAWLQARLSGARFIMRMEDLDQPRVREGSAEQILDDLRWLGLDWDEGPDVGGPHGPYDQSQRTGLYEDALRQLTDAGRVFPCFCSRKDIARAASAPHAGEGGPIYPGTCRTTDITPFNPKLSRNGRLASWRYRAPDRRVCFQDKLVGEVCQDLGEEVGDFVLRRADGIHAYQLAVVVDDGLMGVTDVLRGRDLLASTPRQIELFEALGYPVPRFWHVPLVLDETGARLAKRDGSLGLAELRARGVSAAKIIGDMAFELGLVPEPRSFMPQALAEVISLNDLALVLSEPPAETDGRPIR